MNKSYLKKVFAAYLHDPPEKPLALIAKWGHESYAKEYYLKPLGISEDVFEEAKRQADSAASHFDRLPFTWGEKGREVDADMNLYFIHPIARHHITILTNAQIHGSVKRTFLPNGGFSGDILKGIEEISKESLIKLYWRISFPIVKQTQSNTDTYVANTLLPADTRMPYHSIVDHLETAAAIAAVGGIDNASLLVFNIRSVQDFIRGAIRTKDLWAGSMLVSLLMMEAMGVVIEEYGPQNVLYPSLRMNALFRRWVKERLGIELESLAQKLNALIDEKVPSLPNKVVALVEKGREEELLNAMKEAVVKKWEELVDGAYEYFSEMGVYEVLAEEEEWKKQAKLFPTIAFGWLPADKEEVKKFLTEKKVQEMEELTQKVLSAGEVYASFHRIPLYPYYSEATDNVLNLAKNFQPPPPYEGINVKKICKSDSGSGLEAVVAGRGNRDERLDVISAVKRYLADEVFKFYVPSVSAIAARDAKSGYDNRLLDKIIHEVNHQSASRRLKGLGYPTYDEYRGEREDSPSLKIEYLGHIQAIYEPELYGLEYTLVKEALKVETLEDIPNRVAFLVMDGDKMGAWMGLKVDEIAEAIPEVASGVKGIDLKSYLHPKFVEEMEDEIGNMEKVLGKDKDLLLKLIAGPHYHKAISSALGWFSMLVPFVVKKYGGVLIYAGGDDVMAMFPPSKVLRAAHDIRKLYRGEYGELTIGSIKLDIRDGFIYFLESQKNIPVPIGLLPGPMMTISAGIYIAHFKHPLSLMVKGARRAEDMAKKRRNAIGVIALQRSGVEISAVGAYEEFESMERVYKEFFDRNTGGVSPKFIYEFVPIPARDSDSDDDDEKKCYRYSNVETEIVMNHGDAEVVKRYIQMVASRRVMNLPSEERERVAQELVSALWKKGYREEEDERAAFITRMRILRVLRYLMKGGENGGES